ncbi:MAG: hypothetical protein ACRDP8_22620 [Actinopolymorphaceae bacterium]
MRPDYELPYNDRYFTRQGTERTAAERFLDEDLGITHRVPGGDHESIAQSDTTRQCCGTYAQQKPAGQQPTSTWSASSAGCRS